MHLPRQKLTSEKHAYDDVLETEATKYNGSAT